MKSGTPYVLYKRNQPGHSDPMNHTLSIMLSVCVGLNHVLSTHLISHYFVNVMSQPEVGLNMISTNVHSLNAGNPHTNNSSPFEKVLKLPGFRVQYDLEVFCVDFLPPQIESNLLPHLISSTLWQMIVLT